MDQTICLHFDLSYYYLSLWASHKHLSLSIFYLYLIYLDCFFLYVNLMICLENCFTAFHLCYLKSNHGLLQLKVIQICVLIYNLKLFHLVDYVQNSHFLKIESLAIITSRHRLSPMLMASYLRNYLRLALCLIFMGLMCHS